MGANLIGDGATFRVWAPRATHVYVALGGADDYQPRPQDELLKNPGHRPLDRLLHRCGRRHEYRFFVVGPGGSGFKRDPWARELELYDYPDCDCIVRDPGSYPWHDAGFRPPAFNDLVVYQFHVGVFFARDDAGRDRRPGRVAKFLDALDRIEYLADLGVNALQPLPVVEFAGEWSLGYNGTDIFSPEMDYGVDPADLAPYLERVNALLAKKGGAPLTLAHLERPGESAEGVHRRLPPVRPRGDGRRGLQPRGRRIRRAEHRPLRLPPRHPTAATASTSPARSWAGGRVFAFDRPDVREFLIGNARMFLDEYHADGLRFDEVSVIDAKGGWSLLPGPDRRRCATTSRRRR